jgi:isopentenyl diphosphate isomerase/L-lactate dehydrogenase-like FMN-dependent dehydrogenase
MTYHPRDRAALDRLPLIPRALHDAGEPDLSCLLLGRGWRSPLIRSGAMATSTRPDELALIPDEAEAAQGRVLVFAPERMGALMPRIRASSLRPAAAIALDLTPLAASEPWGREAWLPRSRDDLAEVIAAAGRPVWLLGVASVEDAAVAAEAGIDAIVVDGALGARLGGPATAEILPDVLDAVAGTLQVLCGGDVADGVAAFRALALGADAVVIGGERPSAALEAELRYALRLTGCASLADVGYDRIHAAFGES